VAIPISPVGSNLHVESVGTIPDGVFYFDGASYVALTAGVTLYDPSLNINLLGDLVYRPTATPDDTVDVNLSLDVSDGTVHVSENVSIHERPPTDPNDPGISVFGDPALADQIYGTSGQDVLSGNGGDDIIIGRDGDDILAGGASNDVLDGGAGIDTATYVTASGGVTVDLSILTPQDTGGAGTDTLTGIENILGSAFADALTGDANANSLSGGEGDDILTGGPGSDRLSGGAGADHFVYRSTADGGTIADQTGADHIVTFNIAEGDSIDVLASAFGGGLVAGTDAAGIFGSSTSDTFGSPSERFHFNTSTQTLLYDSNGSDAGGTQVALAKLENGGPVDAAHIHMV
jgi:Ca2+-binding RTX toxin-like protein